MEKKASVSVIDVARAANVSVATVSRSFNNPEVVKPEVRERILEIAVNMGYTANSAAKALRSRKTKVIGAIIPTLDHSIYATMINAFQNKLSEQGYVVYVLSCGFDASNIFDKVTLLLERGAEALLIVGQILDKNLEKYLQKFNIPTICTYSYHHDSIFPFIGFDNYASTTIMTDYLYSLGHRDIRMICGPLKGNDRQMTRVESFKNYMENKHLNYAVIECKDNYNISFGRETIKKIANESPEVTAVICNSDVIAFGVLAGAKEIGINVPEQINVIGYDNLEFAEYLNPPLTTLNIPAEEMGILSAQTILSNLNDKHPLQSFLLETELIIRGSTAIKPQN
ncbi:LacI family DNA-binding transcriptional regulator [uncultured Acinetobacter sp.]|uniref:LacI family DNA-binding transcriptional regulator n=1 Tax=uncultured Acinetobacter sp. TaxID=165433 RepID=UPI0025899984|nr:LacI family DNA-binding transcriptional regulator [uncultured Acinetobacter sp.]